MKQTLVQDALKTVQSPQVLVNIISKRVRQLGQGFRPLVAFDPKLTFMDVALKEVAEGKLGYEMIEVPSAAGTSTTPPPTQQWRQARGRFCLGKGIRARKGVVVWWPSHFGLNAPPPHGGGYS